MLKQLNVKNIYIFLLLTLVSETLVNVFVSYVQLCHSKAKPKLVHREFILE